MMCSTNCCHTERDENHQQHHLATSLLANACCFLDDQLLAPISGFDLLSHAGCCGAELQTPPTAYGQGLGESASWTSM